MRESGMLVLPSGRLLRMYKNSCSQNPGLNDSVGQWMKQEAMKRNIGPEGREGGIILDEMAIQVRIQSPIYPDIINSIIRLIKTTFM